MDFCLEKESHSQMGKKKKPYKNDKPNKAMLKDNARETWRKQKWPSMLAHGTGSDFYAQSDQAANKVVFNSSYFYRLPSL